jgi:ABC-type sugar transport system permease subunit
MVGRCRDGSACDCLCRHLAGHGFYMVLFMASMGSIPTEFYEAAKIDGAGEWDIFRKIALLLLRESLRTAVVFLMIGAMDMFVYVSFLTNETGGPGRAAQVLSSYLYQTTFRQGNFGYSTTLAVVLMMAVASGVQASL